MNPIVIATPLFFLAMGLEFVVSRRRGRPAYRSNDAITSVGLGAMSQLTGLAGGALMLAIYAAAFRTWHATEWSLGSPLAWTAALVFYDLCYYWHHRLEHEVAILWAAHVVHHQSEDYNLSTALRQTSSTFLFGWVFYLPMAVAGVPPLMYVAVGLIDLLYQFWIHTEQVGRLGWFDRVFASPSNHRVHHGVNDRYLDRNYAGILILWDRLFGTYQEEDPAEPVVYGTRKPLRSFNPVWANLEVYAGLVALAGKTRSWRDRLLVFIKPPGWLPADVAAREPHPPFDPAALVKHDPALRAAERHYAIAAFFVLIGVGTQVLAVAGDWPLAVVVGESAWVCVGLYLVGRLFDRQATRTASLLHWATGIALALAGWSAGSLGPWTALVLTGACVVPLLLGLRLDDAPGDIAADAA
jgi:sterol desaturase/sphingolipid hydroxylase (fatty acid hydroxylase superfamily)